MAIRPLKMPGDIDHMLALIGPSFQYPENDDWSIQADEMDSMRSSMRGIKRLWPLLRVVMLLAPQMRDMMRGFIWEEDGQPVGLSNVIRMGASDQWLIGNVSVLPDYRRRGIARKLVEACMALAKERGAKIVTLGVIDGNVPAVALYEKLGYACYTRQHELSREPGEVASAPPLPAGYEMEEIPFHRWQPSYKLMQRITPPDVAEYAPVEEGKFRRPQILRVLFPLVSRVMGAKARIVMLQHTASGQVVGIIAVQYRTRGKGVNDLSLNLDPAHPDLAPFAVGYGLAELRRLSPDHRIQTEVRAWQPALLQAAEAAGFHERSRQMLMGIHVQ